MITLFLMQASLLVYQLSCLKFGAGRKPASTEIIITNAK